MAKMLFMGASRQLCRAAGLFNKKGERRRARTVRLFLAHLCKIFSSAKIRGLCRHQSASAEFCPFLHPVLPPEE
jgi:hypothetical protein